MFEPTLNERRTSADWPMMIALAGLMIVGALFIYSATTVGSSANSSWFRLPAARQGVWYAFGTGLACLICLIPYYTLARWSLVVYWATIVMLILVFAWPMKGGASRWMDFGPVQFQPSEVAKLTFILALANFLSRPATELRSPTVFCKALAMMALPFLLIVKEPDLGSALVLIPVGLAMMFVAGAPSKYLNRLLAASGLIIVLLLVDILFAPPGWQIKLKEYQRQRLMVYFGRDFVPSNATPAERSQARELQRKASYSVEQSLISVGAGGVTGKGWRQGTQNALGFLPRDVAHNDFIFSVIGEESGFVGSIVVLGLYGIVLYCGVRIASQARDRLGKLLAVGVVTLLFSHVFINIGMNIRLVPVTGIPLPLLSYGGSSVVCSLVAAGLLQNVYLHRRHY